MPSLKSIDWPAAAAQIAVAIPRTRLHPAARAWADGRTAAARGPWCIALSGGSDSVALLLLLWAHWPERRRRLVALHFNHRLRGRASDADEEFCRKLCAGLGVKFRCARWRNRPRDCSEAEAREARHAFFERVMEAAASRALWLGHQRDDVAETMLMRLARGSGTAGLSAPRPVHEMAGGAVHARPLLDLGKKELARTLRAAGAPWRDDATNAGPRFLRNRIRRSVIPAWIRANLPRDAVAGAALSRDLLEEDAEALDRWLAELAPLRRDGSLELAKLHGRPRALWRRAIHAWLAHVPVSGLSRQAFASLLAAAEAGAPTRRSLGPRLFARIRRGRLFLESL